MCLRSSHDRFGFYPESTGSYYMDADLTNYIKATYPTVKCASSNLLGGRPQGISYLQQLLVYLHGWRPLGTLDPFKQNTHAPA